MPLTLKESIYTELVIKKSRFLTWVEPVDNVAAAKSRIEAIRKQYPDARHVCFAFYVQGSSGMSDDGEPSGTAAKPMFNVLNHKDLINVLAIVVRYFGGVKLGAGGLARAYGGAVSQALDGVEFQAVEKIRKISIQAPFAHESSVRRICQSHQIELINVEYQSLVNFSVGVVASASSVFISDIKSIAPGCEQLLINVHSE